MRTMQAVAALLLIIGAAAGGEPVKLGEVKFEGEIHAGESLSAVALVRGGEFLVIGADESDDRVQVLKRQDGGYKVLGEVKLPVGDDPDDEIDIEAIACAEDGRTVYVLGSHSGKRGKVSAKKTYAENRAAAAKIKAPLKERDRLFRFQLGADGGVAGKVERTSLRDALDADPVLKPTSRLPGKEGGIDVEGLAVRDGWVYAGLRGPVVVKGQYALVLKARFDDPQKGAELLFLDLDGLGVRDLARVKDGFLVLAGPTGEGGPYRLFHWDGKDTLPGQGSPGGMIRPLGTLPLPTADAKAEGLAVLKEEAAAYEVLIVHDGPAGGRPTRYRVDRPQ